ncbi:SDR family NAD(P)-dependent oxidoreductase [Paenibacillus nicotianae]|uniref:SDR family NAD(P)-dependent oxidoreductase n=1 Tax=Paenibacillus nicotianae TaxID=1526551 RepID=A0ABW4UTE1_9BACL
MNKNMPEKNEHNDDIAVIGIGLKIAGTENLEEYWNIFENNIDCIRDFPEYRKNDVKDFAQLYSKLIQSENESVSYNKAGYLDEIDKFDNEFFKISPIEAQVMDPVQRLLLETIFNAFDDAGYSSEMLSGSKTGIYIGYTPGSTKDNYATNIFYNNPELLKYSNVGNMPCIIPSRASYALNLQGPTMIIDSACSSSLVAIHDACSSIKNGTCTMAIAGGIRLHSFPISYEDMNVGFETDDNKTRTFDNSASGAAIGEGSAVVLLKSLKEAERDKDHIYGVIKGSAVNNDGTSASITAPNPSAQAHVVSDALKVAGISPDEIDYIETHGTATALGDPIEFRGLTSAFEKHTEQKQFCALSSSKSNIGHLYEAAGVASFIKAIAALKFKKIPGSSHFNIPNLKIDFCDSPFYVSKTTKDWDKEGLRTCGISAFGISGTNCHLILQEYKQKKESVSLGNNHILGISAKSIESMKALVKNYQTFLEKEEVDVYLFASNINLYRTHYNKRLAIVFSDKQNLIDIFSKLSTSELAFWSDIEGVYYHNEDKKASDLNYSQIKTMLERCNQTFIDTGSKLDNTSNVLKNDLSDLAQAYSYGAKLNWNLFYQNLQLQHISLPPYPFKKTRFWLPKKEQKVEWNINVTSSNPSPKNENHSPEEKSDIAENLYSDIAEDLYYERIFVKADAITQTTNIEKCLLIKQKEDDTEDLSNSLKEKFFDVDIIELDLKESQKVGIEKYCNQVFKNTNYKGISHIVIANSETNLSNDSEKKLLDMHKLKLLSIVSIYREFKNYDHNIKIVPIIKHCFEITGKEEYLDPNGATIFGLCKSLNRMFKNVSACCIDNDNHTTWNTIVDEICAISNKDIINYRHNQRYQEALTETMTHVENEPVIIKDNGIYIISGGLGGIGFETAMEMTRRAQDISLILIGRSEIPNYSEWNTIVREHPHSNTTEKIERIQQLQSQAKHAEYYAADISNKQAVEAIIKDVNKKYGQINGVIHGAGISGGTTFEEINEEYIQNMLLPKVIGTSVLDHATREQNLDFFLMFSSISTIFSSADLTGYVAGNMYLDSYSHYRKKISKGKSITVNWATWSETGMALKDNFTIDTLFQTIKTKEAIQALFKVLSQNSSSTVIARLNLKDKISLLLKTYPLQLSTKINNALQQNEPINTSHSLSDEIKSSKEYEDIENTLIKVCCKNLGYETLDINNNFFELGANSILLAIIYKDLNELFPNMLQVTDLFAYPSVNLLAAHISNKMSQYTINTQSSIDIPTTVSNHDVVPEEVAPEEKVSIPLQVNKDQNKAYAMDSNSSKSKIDNQNHEDEKDSVAIIGVGLDLPTCKDLDSYWDLLINGINAVRDIPGERSTDITKHLLFKNYTEDQIKFRKSGYLDEVNKFDHAFFGISPRDASLLDPVLRLFLQCCSDAIDDSGYGADGIKGTNTGVFLGYTANIGNAYNRLLYEMDSKLFSAALPIGQVSMTASRTAYMFDLKGPSMVIDTACSSSLVALNMACEQILFGKCDMAIAGGASLMAIPLADGSGMGFESPEEKTRAFANDSSGAAIAEGVGVVLLKSLKQAQLDGDSIYAVIKGSAINQDGSSFGIAAPNYLAQSEAIQKAWENAGIGAEDISYIEAHGTGTQLGDPIEINGIKNAFETMTNAKQICGIGSVKTNIGHANEAAGMCGLFKCILTLQHKKIPATLNFQVPNHNIDFIDSPLYVVDQPRPLQTNREKAIIGISGFGMSGTNAHIILEEAPPVTNSNKNNRSPKLFTISGRTEKAVFELVKRYQVYLNKNKNVNLNDLTATLNIGRKHYAYRLAFVYSNLSELLKKLNELSSYQSFNEIKQDWCFTGRYSIVPENKKDKYSYEITSTEQQKLNEEVKQYYNQSSSITIESYNEIIKLYVKGAKVEWKYLYDLSYTKLNLPTYPYEKNHAWYPIPVNDKKVVELTKPNEDIQPSFFHGKRWIFQKEMQLKFPSKDEAIVIIQGDALGQERLVKTIRDRGVRVINVLIAEENFKKVDKDTYYITPTVDDFKKLFVDLEHVQINKVVHMGACRDYEVSDSQELYQELEYGFFNIIDLVKGFIKARLDQNIQLVVISCNAYSISGEEKHILPYNATALSVGRVIEQEFQNIHCRSIDTDTDSTVNDIIEQLFADHNMYMVGLRKGKSYIEEFDEISLIPETNNRIKDAGTYIITGGTSGIGIQNAKLFSNKANCNLILVSRKGFPDESEWEQYKLKEEYANEIKEFEEIKRNGSVLEFVQCDISNTQDVETMLEYSRKKYGKINGIVHCAGVIKPGFILKKEKESYLSVFAPKIMGTWNLEKLTKQDELDFIILHSSNVTDAGEPGQSCYMAANSFLDSYTDLLNAQGRRTYTVNWVAWKETGMAYKHNTNVDTTTKAITNKEALHGLNQLINSNPQRLVIGQFNEEIDIIPLTKNSRNAIAASFIEKHSKLATQSKRSEVALTEVPITPTHVEEKQQVTFTPTTSKENIILTGNVENIYTPVEMTVGQIYCDILGYQEADIYEGFFDMGGDSLLLTDMHDIINNVYPDIVKIADLFEFDSIQSLAEFITSRLPEKQNVIEQFPNVETKTSTIEDSVIIQLRGNIEDKYTPVEMQIGKIYCDILGYEEADIYEGFFDMGGDSLLLTDMHDIINNVYPDIVKIADLFEFDSIQSLSEFITLSLEKKQSSKITTSEADNSTGLMQQLPLEQYYDMSTPQERIYLDYRLSKNKLVYNIGFVSDVSKNNYEDLVVNANQFFSGFEMLRTSFKIVNKKLVQFVNPVMPIPMEHVKVPSVESIDFKQYLKTFDLSKYPLFNLTVFEDNDKKLLFLDIHHILLDGYSSTLLQEYMDDFAKDEKTKKPHYSYSNYVQFEKDFYQSSEYKDMGQYWKNELETFDFKNPISRKNLDISAYGNKMIELDSELANNLTKFAKKRKTTLFNVLLGAYALALSHFLQRNDIAILTPVLNRYKPEFKDSIGVFTNLIPIRINIQPDQILSDFLKTVSQKTIGGIENQFYQYNHLINDLKNLNPEFFFYMDFEDKSLKKNRTIKDIPHAVNIPKFILDVEIKNLNDIYHISASYQKCYLDDYEVDHILNSLLKILNEFFTNDYLKESMDYFLDQVKN